MTLEAELRSIEVEISHLMQLQRNSLKILSNITKVLIAIALRELGERGSDSTLIGESIDTYTSLLTDSNRIDNPGNWAIAQLGLGHALQGLGIRESGTAKLIESVNAYNYALLEIVRDSDPLLWAETQNNMGISLSIIGRRDNNVGVLLDAVDAHKNALLERTRDRAPSNGP